MIKEDKNAIGRVKMQDRLSLDEMLRLAGKVTDWIGSVVYYGFFGELLEPYHYEYRGSFKSIDFELSKVGGFWPLYVISAKHIGINLGCYDSRDDDNDRIKEFYKIVKLKIEQEKQHRIKNSFHYARNLLK